MSTIKIRPIKISDAENIVKWRNSWEVRKNLYSLAELTIEQHLSYMKKYVETGLCYQFIIVECTDDGIEKDIGTTFLKNVDIDYQKAEFGIFIGEQQTRGKGYGKSATKEILKFAFKELNLNRVYLSVFSDNIAAIRSYECSGFKVEGELIEDFRRYDGFANVTLMGILKSYWKE